MTATAPLKASSVSQTDHSGGYSWTNLSNAVGDTGSAALCTIGGDNQTSDWLIGEVASGLFGAEVIVGFEARIKARYTRDGSYGLNTPTISITKNGAVVGTPKTITGWPESTAWTTLEGSSSDLWGTSGAGSDTWGVAVWAEADEADDLEVFAFELTIYYIGDVVIEAGYKRRRTVLLW